MLKIEELKNKIDDLYGFDISSKSRKYNIVCAKKIFVHIAIKYGFSRVIVSSAINIDRTVTYRFEQDLASVRNMDIDAYNKCIDDLDLKIDKIKSLNFINGSNVQDQIISEIKSLSTSDLKRFKKEYFDKFLKKEVLMN